MTKSTTEIVGRDRSAGVTRYASLVPTGSANWFLLDLTPCVGFHTRGSWESIQETPTASLLEDVATVGAERFGTAITRRTCRSRTFERTTWWTGPRTPPTALSRSSGR